MAITLTILLCCGCGNDSSSCPEVESSSSVKMKEESSASVKYTSSEEHTESSSSRIPETESCSSNIIVGNSSKANSSSSEKLSSSEEESPSSEEESSSSGEQICSSEDSSSSDVYFPDGVMPAGYYAKNCPAGHVCVDAASTTYLNQEMLAAGKYGEILDERDDQVYKVVVIGDQIWMAQSLNYGDSVNTPNLNGATWCGGGHDSEEGDCAKYGRLYTWTATIDLPVYQCGVGKRCTFRNNIQGICPSGWVLPSNEDFDKMILYADSPRKTKASYGTYSFISSAGCFKSSNGWDSGLKSDSCGFSALPSGYYDGEKKLFDYESKTVDFWTITPYGSNLEPIYYLSLDVVSDNSSMFTGEKNDGRAVRCLRNLN